MSSAPTPTAPRWQMPQVPPHWTVVPGWGLRGNAGIAEGSNIYLTEDTLLAGKTLEPYVRTQITLLRRNFADPQIAGPAPTSLLEAAGVEEGLMLLIAHRELDGRQVAQLQVYGRIARWIGIATLTALRENIAAVRKDFELFLAALRAAPESQNT